MRLSPFIFLPVLGLFTAVSAQTTLVETAPAGGYSTFGYYTETSMMGPTTEYQGGGQSFLAAQTAVITSIDIYLSRLDTAGTFDLRIWASSSQSDLAALTSGTPLITVQDVAANATGWVSAAVPNLSIAAGSFYTFTLAPDLGLNAGWAPASSSYADGSPFYETDPGSFLTNTAYSDFAFRVNVSSVPEPSTYAVVLGVLALVGSVSARRRQRT